MESKSAYLLELEHAIDYMPKILKPRLLVIYMFLLKNIFSEGNEKIFNMTHKEIASNFITDMGSIMSTCTVSRNLNELVKLGVVQRDEGNVGQANTYRVIRPSKLDAIAEIINSIKNEKELALEDDNSEKLDYFSDKKRRLEILKRDGYKCSYCLVNLSQDNFELDHITPISKGGWSFESNLTSVCKKCNAEKSTKTSAFLLQELYRKKIISRDGLTNQMEKIDQLQFTYNEIIERRPQGDNPSTP